MFAIGEATSKVYFSKLRLPKEYRLKKKKIFGVWVGNKELYLSDDQEILKAKAGKNGIIYEPVIDYDSRISVPAELEKKEAKIKGCIATIRVKFEDK